MTSSRCRSNLNARLIHLEYCIFFFKVRSLYFVLNLLCKAYPHSLLDSYIVTPHSASFHTSHCLFEKYIPYLCIFFINMIIARAHMYSHNTLNYISSCVAFLLLPMCCCLCIFFSIFTLYCSLRSYCG